MAAVDAEQTPSSSTGGRVPPPSAGLVQHTFSAMFQEEQQLFFQLVVLPRQIYAWVGTAPPRLTSLCLAVPTRLVRAYLLRQLPVQPSLASLPALMLELFGTWKEKLADRRF